MGRGEAKEAPVQPQEILELMGSAPARYESVRAALAYRGDGPTIKAIRERYRRKFTNPAERSEAIRHPEPDAPFGWRCRIWRVDNHRWRQELELPGGGLEIVASTGRVRTSGTPEGPPGTSELWERCIGGAHDDHPGWLSATDTFWTMYPFDPAGFASIDGELARMDLSVGESVSWAGRDAVRLRGAPVEEWTYPPEPLWAGADEYEAVVDAERGILLRLASRLAGRDFDALEVEGIHFDERFPDAFTSHKPLAW